MTSEGLITAPEGITLEDAKKILAKARKEKLPIVDKDGNLKGLITIKDIEKQIKYPLSAKDGQEDFSAERRSESQQTVWSV